MGSRTGIRAASASSILIYFTYRGVQCRERLKLPPTNANLKYAANLRGEILNKIEKGTFDYQEYFPESRLLKKFVAPGALLTVDDLLDQYLGESVEKHNEGKSNMNKLALSTWMDYRNSTRRLKSAIGSIPLTEFTSEDVEKWLAGEKITMKRAKNLLMPLRGALKLAKKKKYIRIDPLYGWQPEDLDEPDKPKSKIDPFSPDEINAILEAAEGPIKNLLQFAFWTGLRTSELIALRWEDIERNAVHVQRAKVRGKLKSPKTDAGDRLVKLLTPAQEALKAQKPLTYFQQGCIFLAPNGKPWRDDGHVRNVAWIPTLKKAGVKYRYPYQTRHTYASMMCSTGENIHWIAAQMGHTTTEMVIRNYGKWIPDVNPLAGSKAEALWASLSPN